MTDDNGKVRRRLRRLCCALAGIGAFLVIGSSSASATVAHWYVNGEPIGESPIKVAGVNQGAFNLGYSTGGVKFNAKCTTASTGGSISNPAGGSAGILTGGSLVLSNCAVTEPPGKGCTVPNVLEFRSLRAELGGSSVSYRPETGENLLILKVTGCSPEALNGEKAMTGSITAAASSAIPGTYEFTRTSGSGLKFGGQNAILLGNYSLADLMSAPVTVGP